jgi:hypothetical protein
MYENGKIRPVDLKTSLQEWREGDKGKWWRGYIQL